MGGKLITNLKKGVQMNVVGMDVSKGKGTVCIRQLGGKKLRKPFDVRHTSSELIALANALKSLDGETRVIMEYTGRYYEPVAQILHNEGLYVSAVNPKLIRNFGDNSLWNIKIDKADARKVVRYGLDNREELRQHAVGDSLRLRLKAADRQYGLYSKQKTAVKNNMIALLDQTYPGVDDLYDSPVRRDKHQKWVGFAKTFWYVDCVRKLSQEAFTERYHKWCKQRRYNFQFSKAVSIYQGAKNLVPTLLQRMTSRSCSSSP